MPNDEIDDITPSILDRLIDPAAGGNGRQAGYTVAQVYVVVQRDLEDLLNTRHSERWIPPEFTEVRNSICAFGMPELTSLEAISEQQRRRIAAIFEDVIRRFEPRLADVHATVVPNKDVHKERTVCIRLEARLAVDPSPPVVFDTVVELATGHHTVKPGE